MAKSRITAWPALLPGVAFGLLLGWLVPGTHADASGGSPSATHRSSREPEREAPTAHSSLAASSDPKARRFVFDRDKLDRLTRNNYKLKLDLTAFDDGHYNSRTDTAFEVLRELLSMTPQEERDLRALLTRNAATVRAYEKAHAKVLVAEPGHILLDMPSLEPIQQEIGASITDGTRAILGDDRAQILQAVSNPVSIVGLNDGTSTTAGQVDFHPPGGGNGYLTVTQPGHVSMFPVTLAADTEEQWISKMQQMLFVRYNHLLGRPAQEAFIRNLATFETPAAK